MAAYAEAPRIIPGLSQTIRLNAGLGLKRAGGMLRMRRKAPPPPAVDTAARASSCGPRAVPSTSVDSSPLSRTDTWAPAPQLGAAGAAMLGRSGRMGASGTGFAAGSSGRAGTGRLPPVAPDRPPSTASLRPSRDTGTSSMPLGAHGGAQASTPSSPPPSARYQEGGATIAAGANNAATARSSRRPLRGAASAERRHSVPSEEALVALAAIEVELSKIEARVSDIATSCLEGDLGQQPGAAKTELALLEARAHKLETHGVDAVYTGALVSGQAEAKGRKRSLLLRLEGLFDDIEAGFRTLKKVEAKQVTFEPPGASPTLAPAPEPAAATVPVN